MSLLKGGKAMLQYFNDFPRQVERLRLECGYIMDASAIIQNDATVVNIRVMTQFTHEYGVYGSSIR